MCPNPMFLEQVLLVGYLPEEYGIYSKFLVAVCVGIAAAIYTYFNKSSWIAFSYRLW